MHSARFLNILAMLLLAPAAFGANPPTPAEHADHKKKTWIRVSSKRSDFFVFTHAGQSISGRFGTAGDAHLTGRMGTVLTTDNSRPVLHDGCLFIECRKGATTISARLANVEIPEGASAIISCLPAKASLKIAVLSSEKNTVTVRTKGIGRALSLHSGEELNIENGQVSEPKKIDEKALKTENADLFSESAGHPMRVLGDDSTMFRLSAEDTITIMRGELFLLATYPIRIRTVIADVSAAKGALVDVSAEDREPELRVKSFNEPIQVTLAESASPIEVKQSQELLIQSGELTDSNLTPADGIGRRRSQKMEISKTLHGAFSDFSMASFLDQSGHMTVIKHPLSPSDKDLRERFLKSAAAVQTISGQYGPYRAMPKLNRKRPETKIVQPGA